jgi:hypothetical protein
MILFKTINLEKMCTRYLTLCRKYVSYSVSWDFPEKNVYEFISINAFFHFFLTKTLTQCILILYLLHTYNYVQLIRELKMTQSFKTESEKKIKCHFRKKHIAISPINDNFFTK